MKNEENLKKNWDFLFFMAFFLIFKFFFKKARILTIFSLILNFLIQINF